MLSTLPKYAFVEITEKTKQNKVTRDWTNFPYFVLFLRYYIFVFYKLFVGHFRIGVEKTWVLLMFDNKMRKK